MAIRHKVVRLESCFADGVTATRSVIEISLSPGIPTFDITGLCDSSIRESKGRIISAIRSLGCMVPKGHIMVSISPAYMHKSGSGFDLPIALGILFLAGTVPYSDNVRVYAQGELSLAGDIKGTPASALRLTEAAKDPADIVFVPEEETDAAACSGISCMTVRSLYEVCDILNNFSYTSEVFEFSSNSKTAGDRHYHFLSELKGQSKAKEALVIACAGMHSLLMLGSPGSGKTLAAEITAGLMPALDGSEARQCISLMESAQITADEYSPGERPFRRIYSNCTLSRLNGRSGGSIPGELALSNNGILFADEITDFDPKVIDELKVPLEEHVVRIHKDGNVRTLPASFLFVAAGNPCRCGLYYEKGGKCKCTPTLRRRYLNRLSGGFLDRIDLFTEMRQIDSPELTGITQKNDRSCDLEQQEALKRITQAWKMQSIRYCWTEGVNKTFNGTCERTDKELFRFSDDVASFAADAAVRTGLSARGYKKLMRVARTIADMEGSETVETKHVRQALIYKVKEYG